MRYSVKHAISQILSLRRVLGVMYQVWALYQRRNGPSSCCIFSPNGPISVITEIDLTRWRLLGSAWAVFTFWMEKGYFFQDCGKNLSKTYASDYHLGPSFSIGGTSFWRPGLLGQCPRSCARVARAVKKYRKKEVQNSRAGRPGRQKEVPRLCGWITTSVTVM